jgi:hypothetical protein
MTNVSSETANYTTTTAAGLTTYDFTGWQNGGNDGGILVRFETTAGGNPVAGTAAVVNSISIVEIGCVSDYDLAFANPTQSLMVQDRSGAADGTSSATGVTQVTPIEQLNSKSARIGTSAATPADGELAVSGTATIAGTTGRGLVISNETESYTNSIAALDAQHSQGILSFKTAGTEHLRIDSAGNSTFSGTVTAAAVKADNSVISSGLLQLVGGSGYTFDVSSENNTAGTAGNRYKFQIGSGAAEFLFASSSGTLALLSSTGLAVTGAVTTTGNVGIGTSSPEAALDVNSTVAGGAGTVYGAIIRGTEAAGADLLAGDGIGLKFEIPYNGAATNIGASIEAIKASATDNNSSTDLLFKTSANNETLATRLTIDSAGLSTFSAGIVVNDAAGSFAQIETGGAISVADDATISLATGYFCKSALIYVYEGGSGKGGLVFLTYSSAAILVANGGNVAATDSDGDMCVYKSASSHTATFKNRMGGTKTFYIAQVGGTLA